MTEREIEALLRKSDALCPRESLKDEILARVQTAPAPEAKTEALRPARPLWRRLLPLVACFLLALGLLGGGIGLRNEHYQTVYVDVNPSAALMVNRFGGVSGVEYLNEDAKAVLSEVDLIGERAENALERMIVAYSKAGYFEGEDAYVSISALLENNKNADKLLARLAARAEKLKEEHGYSVSASRLTKEEQENAKMLDIPAGKYRVILEIMAKDGSYTLAELKELSVGELKKILKEMEK